MNELELFDLTERHAGEGKGRCPRRFTGEHEDLHPSCSVNFDKGVYHCPVCKVGGKIDEMLRLVTNEETPVAQDVTEVENVSTDDEMLKVEHRNWLAARGLSLDNPRVSYVSIQRGDDDYLGICQVDGGIAQQRRMTPDACDGKKAKPRYLTMDMGGKKSKLFWASALPERGGLVWLAEGPLDAVALAEAGASCGVASMGSDISDQQAYELRDYFVIVAYDRDAAGVVGAEKAAKQIAKFGGTCVVVELPDAGGAKDPGDLLQNSRDVLEAFISTTELEYQPDEQRYVEAWRGFSSFDPVPTGLAELDTVLGGGWLPGVHVVKGPPKSYKSTVMLACARAAARRGCGVLYLSTELSRREIWARLSAGIAGAPAWNVLETSPGELPEECFAEQAQLAKYIKTFHNIPIKRLLQVADQTKPQLVIIDYLQGISSIAGEDASAIGAQLKKLSTLLTGWSRDTKTAVLAVSSSTGDGTATKYSKDPEYDAASVSSIKQSGFVSGKSSRLWHFEMVRRGIPKGVDSTVTLNMEELV